MRAQRVTRVCQTGLQLGLSAFQACRACPVGASCSIFYSKKLITYNSFIKDYDFYNPNNILVLDSNEEDINIIHDFLSYPVNYESEYLDRYSLFSWIERLDTNKLIDDVIRNEKNY